MCFYGVTVCDFEVGDLSLQLRALDAFELNCGKKLLVVLLRCDSLWLHVWRPSSSITRCGCVYRAFNGWHFRGGFADGDIVPC